MATPQIPKLRVPLELDGSSLRTVEQDDPREIIGCVYAVMATPVGSRIEEPDFGIESPAFEQLPVDDAEWLSALDTWEPRASALTSQQIGDEVGDVLMEVGAR